MINFLLIINLFVATNKTGANQASTNNTGAYKASTTNEANANKLILIHLTRLNLQLSRQECQIWKSDCRTVYK